MNLEQALAEVAELDHVAHLLRRLHDNEFSGEWRKESREDHS